MMQTLKNFPGEADLMWNFDAGSGALVALKGVRMWGSCFAKPQTNRVTITRMEIEIYFWSHTVF